MGIWNKIYRTWTNSPREELEMMVEEFILDYYYDDFVQGQLVSLQQAVVKGDWYAVEALAQALYGYMNEYDLTLFLRVLEEVQWSTDI